MCDSHQPLNGADSQTEWHSPQCIERSKTRFPGCWCKSISPERRAEIESDWWNAKKVGTPDVR